LWFGTMPVARHCNFPAQIPCRDSSRVVAEIKLAVVTATKPSQKAKWCESGKEA
jgi:hypothetical protein